MKAAEKLAANLLKKIIIREEAEWPPVCSGLIYQPERPAKSSMMSIKTSLTLTNRQK